MSVILNFTEIERNADAIISENKTCGLFEINNDKKKKINQIYSSKAEIFNKLLKDPHSVWKGEVYNIPPIHNYIFYLLALDFDSSVGYRNEEDYLVVLAFEPQPIYAVVSQANRDFADDGLKELEVMLEHAVESNSLIMVDWG